LTAQIGPGELFAGHDGLSCCHAQLLLLVALVEQAVVVVL
jgi:hypothetical protein